MTQPRLARLSLRANFRWTFVGNVVNVAAQWGMLTALSKLGSAATVGQFTLGLYVAAPVMAAVMMHLRMIQVTDAKGEFAFEHYFGARIVLATGGFLLIAGVACLAGYSVETAVVVILVGLAKCVESISEIILGLFQRHERMDISSISLMIRGPAGLAGLALLMWLTDSIVISAAAMGAAWALVLTLYDLPRALRLLAHQAAENGQDYRASPSFDSRKLRPLLWRALPLATGAFLLSLQVRIPGYILEAYHGEAALGYFGAMAYTAVMGGLVVAAIGQSASPRLASYFIDNPLQFRRLMIKLAQLGLLVGALFIAGTIAVGKPALRILYRPDYADYYPEFIILAVAGAVGFLANFTGFGLIATRVFKVQLISGIATCTVIWAPAFWLIPRYGVRGAAVTVLITTAVKLVCQTIGLIWLARRREFAVQVAQADGC